MKTADENREAAFAAAAMIVPAVEAGVGRNWLPVLIVGLASELLYCIQREPKGELPGWMSMLRVATMLFLASWLMGRIAEPWPGRAAEYVVPLAVLVLAAASVRMGSEEAAAAAGVLRYGIYGVLALLLVAGVKEVSWQELRPKAELPDGALAAILLLPLMSSHKRGSCNALPLAAILGSIVAAGAYNLYEYSRTLSINGAAERMESIAACAITAGYFGMLSWLLDGCAKERKDTGSIRKRNVLLMAVAVYGLYILNIAHRPWIYVLMELLLWGILPPIVTMKRNLKKYEKSA